MKMQLTTTTKERDKKLPKCTHKQTEKINYYNETSQ